MKTFFANPGRLIGLAVVTLLPLITTAAAPIPPSPVGPVWDCVLSGNRKGAAQLEFFNDGTFFVHEVIVPNQLKVPSDSGRGGPGTGTRDGSGGTTTNNIPGPQIFGSETTNGLWFFDIKGRTIGFFVELSQEENCVTTAIPESTNVSFGNSSPTIITNGADTDPTFCVTLPTATNVVANVINYKE